ncbi:MAG: hypothetical protein Q4D16_02555 [Eubacteriales bacterium]|nr:hypothetical protein [Eubacteriales bacterium]
MSDDQRGTIIRQGNVMRINNAFVENVSCNNGSGGNILISYSERDGNNSVSIQKLQLNINRNTTVLSPLGQSLCLCCIRKGMWVNVIFSSRMTMSIPPQANAFLVAIQRNPQPPRPPFPPQPPRPPQASSTTTGRIVLIDFDNNFFITEAPKHPHNQIRFNVTNTTVFRNRFGIPMSFSSLQPGQMVKVTHADFMTASIPPQTTAFNVQLL